MICPKIPIPRLNSSVGVKGSNDIGDKAMIGMMLRPLKITANINDSLIYLQKEYDIKHEPLGTVIPGGKLDQILRKKYFASLHWQMDFFQPMFKFYFSNDLSQEKRNWVGPASYFVLNSLADYFRRDLCLTSTVRTPEKQAELMINDYRRLGMRALLQRYSNVGDRVVRDIAELTGSSLPENIAIIAEKIRSIHSGGEKVSNHIATFEEFQLVNIVDISMKSLEGISKDSFESVLIKLQIGQFISKYIREDSNNCFHLEIPYHLEYASCSAFFCQLP